MEKPSPIKKSIRIKNLQKWLVNPSRNFRMGAKVLNSDNEDIKQRVLSGETSISAGYKELTQSKKEEQINANIEINNTPSFTTTKPIIPKTYISEEVKQICADLKTEKIMRKINQNSFRRILQQL